MLRAPVDLLWNGGVGTYVRADDETDADAQDKANDRVRVTASQLRCKVIGEGGNLGLTQQARIAFALRGGRVNADFIDNAAGVATSDLEVNLKIALDSGNIATAQRNTLLAGATDDVAARVLADNADQSLAISMAAAWVDMCQPSATRAMEPKIPPATISTTNSTATMPVSKTPLAI